MENDDIVTADNVRLLNSSQEVSEDEGAVHIDLSDFIVDRNRTDTPTSGPGPHSGNKVVFDENQLKKVVENLTALLSSLNPAPEQPEETIIMTKKKPKISERIVNRLLLITFAIQVINIGILWILDASSHENGTVGTKSSPEFIAGVVIMVLLQFTQLLFVVVTSVKLTKQMLHDTATEWFLIQSYLSTVLLFAGIYTLIYRVAPSHWNGIIVDQNAPGYGWTIGIFVQFLYFSIATMTSTGYGDITPNGAFYLFLIVSFHMLLAVVYTTTIFAKGFQLLSDRKHQKKENFFQKNFGRLRSFAKRQTTNIAKLGRKRTTEHRIP